MPMDRKMLDQIKDDWVDNGVMAYDRPISTNSMSYHVMMPTEELLPYISAEYRAPKDIFDNLYRYFIETGPQQPVMMAIGKNGRIKIIGNEDLVWFAKRSGLAELPVQFVFQMQA